MAKENGVDKFQKLVLEQLSSQAQFQQFVVEQFGSLHVEIKEIRSDIGAMKDVLYPLAKAFDIDSQTLVNHGQRLTRVEDHLGFKQA